MSCKRTRHPVEWGPSFANIRDSFLLIPPSRSLNWCLSYGKPSGNRCNHAVATFLGVTFSGSFLVRGGMERARSVSPWALESTSSTPSQYGIIEARCSCGFLHPVSISKCGTVSCPNKPNTSKGTLQAWPNGDRVEESSNHQPWQSQHPLDRQGQSSVDSDLAEVLLPTRDAAKMTHHEHIIQTYVEEHASTQRCYFRLTYHANLEPGACMWEHGRIFSPLPWADIRCSAPN